MTKVKVLRDDEEIMSSLEVMKQLRQEFQQETPDNYLRQVRKMEQKYQYRLAAAFDQDEIRAVIGFRVEENFAWGRYMCVDEFVTDQKYRGKGYGQILFDWLVQEAKTKRCQQIHLDSGVPVHRHAAHRFYVKNNMIISCHHFETDLI